MKYVLPPASRDALNRLLAIAFEDTNQSKRCADFLLAWWSFGKTGGWNPMDLSALDLELKMDVFAILVYIATPRAVHPDTLGYESQFKQLAHNRHPDLFDPPCPY